MTRRLTGGNEMEKVFIKPVVARGRVVPTQVVVPTGKIIHVGKGEGIYETGETFYIYEEVGIVYVILDEGEHTDLETYEVKSTSYGTRARMVTLRVTNYSGKRQDKVIKAGHWHGQSDDI
ncbi:MAG: hypothetical protein V1838_03230 [Patescibacteria group bacterium]